MLDHERLKRELMKSAVHVIATDGLDRTTTKAISIDSGRNEVYIYREYENKEDLMRAAFIREDKRLVYKLLCTFPVMRDTSVSWKERCYMLWEPIWRYLLDDDDRCFFYIRYYYSSNFKCYAEKEHVRCFKRIKRISAPVFKEGTDVSILLYQVFEAMLSGAYHVRDGRIKDSEVNCRRVFDQVYLLAAPHFCDEVLNGVDPRELVRKTRFPKSPLVKK